VGSAPADAPTVSMSSVGFIADASDERVAPAGARQHHARSVRARLLIIVAMAARERKAER